MMTMGPKWSVPKCPKSYYNEQELNMKALLPDVGRYNTAKGFKSIYRPYAKKAFNVTAKPN